MAKSALAPFEHEAAHVEVIRDAVRVALRRFYFATDDVVLRRSLVAVAEAATRRAGAALADTPKTIVRLAAEDAALSAVADRLRRHPVIVAAVFAVAHAAGEAFEAHPPMHPFVRRTVRLIEGGAMAYNQPVRVVERLRHEHMREFPLGFFQSGIGAGVGPVDVASSPQVLFKGRRLVVPSTVAPFFSLVDISVGDDSQLANSTPVPAQIFVEDAVGIALVMDTLSVGQDVVLSVVNIDPVAAHTFQAALIGTVAQ